MGWFRWFRWFSTAKKVKNAKAPICENDPSQICPRVAQLDERINNCDLHSEQNRVHGTLIHRLPTEILGYLFELLLPRQEDKFGPIPQYEGVMPTYLASVCRLWRDIVWSNPSLWSTIHIRINGLAPTAESGLRIKFSREWIMRSRTLPLTLQIDANGSEHEEKELIDVFHVLNECSNRLHTLDLYMSPHLLRAFFTRYKIRCPQLKCFRIRSGEGCYEIVLFVDQTASPVQVEISEISIKSSQISWIRLSFATSYLNDILRILQQVPQLTECFIFSLRHESQNPLPPITLPQLKKLSLTHPHNWVTAMKCLRSLTLPNLQEFSTSEMCLLSPSGLPALVHRSSCPLTSIKLSGELEIVENLQPFAGVTDLYLDATGKYMMINKLLLEGYLPDLRHLILPLRPFIALWDSGIILELLNRKRRPRSDVSNASRLRKLIVEERGRDRSEFGAILNSDIGKELKTMKFGWTEYGFEIMIMFSNKAD